MKDVEEKLVNIVFTTYFFLGSSISGGNLDWNVFIRGNVVFAFKILESKLYSHAGEIDVIFASHTAEYFYNL